MKPAACRARRADSTARTRPGDLDFEHLHAMFLRLAGAVLGGHSGRRRGVDLRDPLKPWAPADDQAIVLPCASVTVIMVLLKVELTWATPVVMFLRSRRRTRVASLAMVFLSKKMISDTAVMPAATPARSGSCAPREFLACRPTSSCRRWPWPDPLRVRAFVWVRWPRTGSERR